MSELLPCVEINPTHAATPKTVLWLHGLGASGHDFEPIVPTLQLPHIRFVFPHAPQIPVTINGGMMMPAWYDIRSLEESDEREDPVGIQRAAQYVQTLLLREIDNGVSPSNIVLAGFSQGAAMALHVGLRWPQSLAGIMVLSGYLLLPETLEREAHEANRETPMLMCHGTQDPTVSVSRGRNTHALIDALNPARSMLWHEYEMGHSVCPEEILTVGQWLGAQLPQG